MAAEDRSMELKVKYDGLQELIVTLKDGQGAKKVCIHISSVWGKERNGRYLFSF